MNSNSSSLDDIFAKIEEEEASTGKNGSGALDVIQCLADNDGLMMVSELIRDGHTESAIAASLQSPGNDGRSKPRAKAGVIDGQRLLWLTSSGWTSVGQSNRRESPPSSSRVQHRLAIPRFASWIEYDVSPKTTPLGLFWNVALGNKSRELIETYKQAAWSLARMNSNAEAISTHSQLLGGIYPDAIVVSSLPETITLPNNEVKSRADFRLTYHPKSFTAHDLDSIARPETISAIEVELSAKSTPALDAKVRQHDAALNAGWWNEVVWIDDAEEVATRLRRSGVGTKQGHCIVDASDVGISKTPVKGVVTDWWPAITFTSRH